MRYDNRPLRRHYQLWNQTQPSLIPLPSGAIFIWGLRKLVSGYSGNAIRVRRSSDNAEQDIGFAGNGLNVSDLLGFVGANNGFVVTGYDQSGNGHNCTQATAANQPQVVAAGVLLTGSDGKCAMRFDGDKYLEIADSPALSTGDIDFTVVAACELATKTDFGIFLSKWDDTGNNGEYMLDFRLSADRLRFVITSDGSGAGGKVVEADAIESPVINQRHILQAWHENGAEIRIKADGNAENVTAHTLGLDDKAAAVMMGRRQNGADPRYLDGRIEAVAFYKKRLNNNEKQQVLKALA